MTIIPFGKPIINLREINKVKSVLNSGILTHGKIGLDFEKKFSKFTNLNNCLTLSSCTAALYLAYKACNLKKGDEFIVPSQTHVATVNAGLELGAKPIFVDCELKTGNIDLKQLKKKISKKTKLITLVHFLGKPVNIKEILKLKKKYKFKIVEDCALALGSKYYGKHVGFYSDFACFSFYPAKHITTGDGGMIYCKTKSDYNKVKLLRGFGVNKSFFERKIPGIYDVVDLGLNFRLSDINSAVGLMQLEKINHFLKIRKKNYHYLKELLISNKKIEILKTESEKIYKLDSSYYCLSIILKKSNRTKRNLIIKKLSSMGVGCSVYYPRAIPDYTYYKNKFSGSKVINSRIIADKSISLPVAPHISIKQLDFIAKIVKEVLNKEI